jgi:hypothetical protein
MDAKVLDKAKDIADYIAFIITEFSLKHRLSMKQSFDYMYNHGAIEFLDRHYEVEHCENPIITLDIIQRICKRSGGGL